MQPTRRTAEIAALAATLAAIAIIFSRPLVLAGIVALGTWAIAHQLRLHRVANDMSRTATVEQRPQRTALRAEETTPTTLAMTLPDPTPLPCSLTAGIPTAARRSSELRVTLDRGMARAEEIVPIDWPIAGRHQFSPATVTVDTPVVAQSMPLGPTPTVTVTPRGPRNVHVGAGGEPIAVGYGEHDAGRLGAGLEPAELREYVTGDDARRIDWNATARLTEVYVREFEAETDRRTLFVCDHRTTMADGPEAETKLDYCRTVALALAETTRAHHDPLGLVTIDDEGISDTIPSGTGVATHRAIRETLLDLDVSPANTPTRRPTRRTAAAVRHTAATLEHDDSTFARSLSPFFRAPDRVAIAEEPLASAVRTMLRQERETTLTVFFTDDASRPELQEAVQLASRPGRSALVIIAPTALFTDDEPEGAYREYVDFERFRRQLDARPRVRALEVGPRDSVSAVLAAGHDTRGRLLA